MPFDDPSIRVEIEIPHREEIAILDKMAEILSTPAKWCKHTVDNHEGARCLFGALNEADHGDPGAMFATKAAHAVAEKMADLAPASAPFWISRIVLFNNAATTEHPDITSLIQRTRASFE